jgi:hypothetical protein
MASFAFKTILAIALVVCIFTQDPILIAAAPGTPSVSKTFPNPDPSWTEYQVKSCCPKGFN